MIVLEGIIWFLNNLVIEIESPSSLRLYQYSISSQSLLPASWLRPTWPLKYFDLFRLCEFQTQSQFTLPVSWLRQVFNTKIIWLILKKIYSWYIRYHLFYIYMSRQNLKLIFYSKKIKNRETKIQNETTHPLINWWYIELNSFTNLKFLQH